MQPIAHSELWLTSGKRGVGCTKKHHPIMAIHEGVIRLRSLLMVNPRKDWRDTLHALLAPSVHRPGHRLILIEVCCVAYQKGNTQCPVSLSPPRFVGNLLSLQSTADLLATTQSRLSTGKSVNSALDNPTNFFTAQSLDNRASDINNLLDGIANGVQVLQARQHRHHLAAEADRQREVDRQPGAADHRRLFHRSPTFPPRSPVRRLRICVARPASPARMR